MTKKPALHPACEVFPALPQDEIQALVEDIGRRGLLEPITVCDGKLLDGRARWEACESLGIPPCTNEFVGDPIAFAASKNRRLYLSKSQMAMVLARLAKLATAERRSPITKLHAMSGVSTTLIRCGKKLLDKAQPHIIDMVDRRDISIMYAIQAVRNNPLDAQTAWTPEIVKQLARQAIARYPSSQKGYRPKRGVPKARRPKFIDPPYLRFEGLTEEEKGIAHQAPLPELFAHQRQYGRVQLHPKAVRDMMNRNSMLVAFLTPLMSAANDRQPDVEGFFRAIDEMLAWVPQKDGKNGFNTDFAARARHHLATLRDRGPMLYERLGALLEALKSRDRCFTASGPRPHPLPTSLAASLPPTTDRTQRLSDVT